MVEGYNKKKALCLSEKKMKSAEKRKGDCQGRDS